MLSHRSRVLNCIKQLYLVRTNTNVATAPSEKWNIVCSVCLERKPVISRPPTELELKVSRIFQEVEDEKSMKSAHELQHEADRRRAAEMKKGKISSEDFDKAIGQTAIEYEDTCRKEFDEFPFAPRTTQDDETNNTKSTNRKLDRHIVYVVKETLGEKDIWIFPEGVVQGEESLREAADRILREKYGRKVKAKFYGNAPFGYYKCKYSNAVKEKTGTTGMKIFFMKAEYLGGDMEENEKRLDYIWATRSELQDHLHNNYHKSIKGFLINEEH